tara:strand:+ start:42 stop:269 length:228 start_codon:yes stop_codon:yes gene_type:complete
MYRNDQSAKFMAVGKKVGCFSQSPQRKLKLAERENEERSLEGKIKHNLQKGKSPFSFERTGASWRVRACVEIIEK